MTRTEIGCLAFSGSCLSSEACCRICFHQRWIFGAGHTRIKERANEIILTNSMLLATRGRWIQYKNKHVYRLCSDVDQGSRSQLCVLPVVTIIMVFWGANLEFLHLDFKIKVSRGVGKVCKVLVSARSEGPCPSTNHTDQLSQYCHKHLAIIGSLLLSGSADPRPQLFSQVSQTEVM